MKKLFEEIDGNHSGFLCRNDCFVYFKHKMDIRIKEVFTKGGKFEDAGVQDAWKLLEEILTKFELDELKKNVLEDFDALDCDSRWDKFVEKYRKLIGEMTGLPEEYVVKKKSIGNFNPQKIDLKKWGWYEQRKKLCQSRGNDIAMAKSYYNV